MRWLFRTAAAVMLVASAACSESSDVELVTDSAGYSVGLIDPGDDADRVTIRVASDPGASQAIRMVVDMDMGVAGQSVEQAQTMDITYTVVDVVDDIISIEATYDDMTLESSQPGIDDSLTDVFVGTTLTIEMTERGAVVGVDYSDLDEFPDVPGLPAGLGPQFFEQMLSSLEDNMASMSVPTPVEPIGVGASWSVTNDMTMLGMPLTLTTEITLTDISGDRATGEISQELIYQAGDVDLSELLPGGMGSVPDGFSLSIGDGSELSGSGTIEYLLNGGVVPLLNMDLAGSITLEAQGQTIEQSMTMTQTTTER